MLTIMVLYEKENVKVIRAKDAEKIIDAWDGPDSAVIPCDRWMAFNYTSLLWIAIDNQTNNCWVEEFSSEDSAIKWLNDGNKDRSEENQRLLGRTIGARARRTYVDSLFSEILIFAVRYAIGRRTYAVTDTVRLVKRVINKIDARYIDIMIDEIWNRRGIGYGGEAEKAQWERLLGLLEEERKERKEKYGNQ